MRIGLLTLPLLFTTLLTYGQQTSWLKLAGVVEGDTYAEIIQKGNDYYDNHPEAKKNKSFYGYQYDSQYKKFKRFEDFWTRRLDESGNLASLSPEEMAENYRIARQQSDQRSAWVNINQTMPGTSTGYDGMGRATSIAFHPTDVNTFIISGAIGGLWYTTNGGNSYTPIADNLPTLTVSDVVFDPDDPNTIYAATGDAVWYGNGSMGVFKSTDLGQNWSATDLTYNLSADVRIPKLLINPENGQTLFAATGAGLNRTLDGGQSWDVVLSGFNWDIVYKPGDTTTLYAMRNSSGNLEVFKSTNGGSNFTQVSSIGEDFSSYSPSFLAISPADPDRIYYMNGESQTIHRSIDGGNTWTLRNNNLDAWDGFTVSQSSENTVYLGQLNNYRSNNGGTSFTKKSHWYNNGTHTPVHADTRRIVTNPLQNDKVYFCNDGGVYVYDETADSWDELSEGVVIMQYYSVAVAQTDPFMVMGGTQDNGTRIRTTSPTWRAGNGGDGMECAIDNTDEDILYCTYVNGELFRSNDAWNNDTYNEITPTDTNGDAIEGNWVTPFVLDPSNNANILGGYDEAYYSTDYGDSWTKISDGIVSGNITEVGIHPADGNYLYLTKGNQIKYTSDMGANWTSRNILSIQEIQSITFHESDTNKWWVSCGGYNANHKVFYTENNGQSFTNITAGLPNCPINKIVYQNGGNGRLYVGTDLGVYTYDGNTWQAMNDQLPLTEVRDVEIQYSGQKIRIGTHGRGIWETDLLDPLLPDGIDEELSDKIKVYPNPSSGQFNVQVYSPSKNMTWEVYDLSGRLVWAENGPNNPIIDLSKQSKGIYILRFSNGESFGTKRLILE